MNNYAPIEYNIIDNRLKAYIKELNMCKKMNKVADSNLLKKKYNITAEDNNKIKKYIIDKKYFPSAEFRNKDIKFQNKKINNYEDNNVIINENINTYPNENLWEKYNNRLSSHSTNIDKKKNNKTNYYQDQYHFINNNELDNINDYENVFKNSLFFDDSEKIKNINSFNYKFPLYPASHYLESQINNHNKGKNEIINSIDKYNEIYNKNLTKILNTTDNEKQINNEKQMKYNSESCLLKLKNIDIESDFKKGLPSRAFINDKRNKKYDNPIEHYFSYIGNDIQDPDHVVMAYPQSTRMSNKQHMEKYKM